MFVLRFPIVRVLCYTAMDLDKYNFDTSVSSVNRYSDYLY